MDAEEKVEAGQCYEVAGAARAGNEWRVGAPCEFFDSLEEIATAFDDYNGGFWAKYRAKYDGPFHTSFYIRRGQKATRSGYSYLANVTNQVLLNACERPTPNGRPGRMARLLERGLREILLAAPATDADMLNLFGSDKQIAWAAKIRAGVALSNPTHPLLRTEASAAKWIEIRDTIVLYPTTAVRL